MPICRGRVVRHHPHVSMRIQDPTDSVVFNVTSACTHTPAIHANDANTIVEYAYSMIWRNPFACVVLCPVSRATIFMREVILGKISLGFVFEFVNVDWVIILKASLFSNLYFKSYFCKASWGRQKWWTRITDLIYPFCWLCDGRKRMCFFFDRYIKHHENITSANNVALLVFIYW
jgi:hypothetical protein